MRWVRVKDTVGRVVVVVVSDVSATELDRDY